MIGKFYLRSDIRIGALLLLRAGIIAWALSFSGAGSPRSDLIYHGTELRPAGYPQLISVEPLPDVEASACAGEPAGGGSVWAAFQQNESSAADRSPTEAASIDAERAPARAIHDSYPTFSAVGLDLAMNEVYLQDENLFGLLVFDRTTNTPAAAASSAPKRRLWGTKTHLEFNTSIYVDPKNGDVYSINNDMVDKMAVFPRGAAGDVSPKRLLHTPHRTFGIAADEEAQELYIAVQDPAQVVVYRKTAQGEEKPLRTVRGPATGLEDAHGIALDKKNNWMFVSNHGHTRRDGGKFDAPSIAVYPLKADGDVAPLRTIQGPKSQLNWPALIALDSERGELFVANDMGDSILVFHANDEGDVTPTRVIKGPKTGLKNPTGVYLDLDHDEIWVANMGNHSATAYPRGADGDAAPLRTIRGSPANVAAQMIGNPGAVGYDRKREEILVPN